MFDTHPPCTCPPDLPRHLPMCASCEARFEADEAKRVAAIEAYEARAETFGTEEWAARFDAEKRELADWRAW